MKACTPCGAFVATWAHKVLRMNISSTPHASGLSVLISAPDGTEFHAVFSDGSSRDVQDYAADLALIGFLEGPVDTESADQTATISCGEVRFSSTEVTAVVTSSFGDSTQVLPYDVVGLVIARGVSVMLEASA